MTICRLLYTFPHMAREDANLRILKHASLHTLIYVYVNVCFHTFLLQYWHFTDNYPDTMFMFTVIKSETMQHFMYLQVYMYFQTTDS